MLHVTIGLLSLSSLSYVSYRHFIHRLARVLLHAHLCSATNCALTLKKKKKSARSTFKIADPRSVENFRPHIFTQNTCVERKRESLYSLCSITVQKHTKRTISLKDFFFLLFYARWKPELGCKTAKYQYIGTPLICMYRVGLGNVSLYL